MPNLKPHKSPVLAGACEFQISGDGGVGSLYSRILKYDAEAGRAFIS